MPHVSLYRKWRPRTFEAVAGQEPVVRTLRRAIETGRVAHAYLFSGPRGTGKTSTAKVLAMGMNCQGHSGPTPEPDGTCESCRAIINNSSMDVLEMDAASNRGIDEIRDLRDRVNLAPTQGRSKVYIIDEVHMLTTEAFNALLKMLEEPPEHVVFVLATTEKHKVLPTIISRCQSFDFRRPGVALLAEKLGEIADAEGMETEPAALTLIAREGRGSFRDAEGLLDQLSSFADGGPITAARVRELLGSVGSEVLLETTDALYERRAADALRLVDRLQNEGRDLSRFVAELISHLRRLMLLPHAPEVALSEVGDEERAALEEQAARVPTAEVVRVIESLDNALQRARRGGDAKLELELAFLKLARDYKEPSLDVLLGRLEALEKAVENGATNGVVPSAPSTVARAPETPPETPVVDGGASDAERGGPSEAEPDRGSGDEDGADGGDAAGSGVAAPNLSVDWGSVMQELRARRQVPAAALYENARVGGYGDGMFEVVFPKSMETLVRFAGDPKYTKPLQEVLEGFLGERPRLELRIEGEAPEAGGPVAVSAPGPARAEPEAPTRSQTPRPAPRPEPEPPPVEEPPLGEPPPVEASAEPLPEPPEPEMRRASAGSPTEVSGDGSRIRDSQEVFVLAQEFFGPARGSTDGGTSGDG